MEFAVYRKARQEYEAETKKIFIAKESEQTIEDKWYDGLRAIDTMGHGPQSEDADLNRMYAYYYGSIEHHLSFDGYYFCDFGLKLAALDENRKLQEIEQLKKLAEQETEEGKLRLKYGIGDDVFAAAAAHFGTTRQLADKIKGALEGQLAVTKDCPYCGLPLGDAMHADHIYPVFKGGLSTIENMVLICDQCNLKKGSKTLRQFIAAYKLDGKRIELVLESLGKHF
ncbi:MAG: HNH endonuclease [Planctomycetes bacterium]|nr:HNH endonuclease [Planctomycetota bacterium]MBU4399751.1 HNH endonuclease [Planctomycetota bacterium]